MEKYEVCKYIKVSEDAEKRAIEDVRTHYVYLVKALHYNVAYSVGRLHKEYMREQLGIELDKLL